MYDTDIRHHPAARALTLDLSATNHRATRFVATHGRQPHPGSTDPLEADLAAELAHTHAFAIQSAQTKRHARQIVTAMFSHIDLESSTR